MGYKKKKNKKAIAMSFNWIFAILAGVVILFLAIYGVTRFVETGEKTIGTETAAQISALLDPLETGLASGKSAQINFKKEAQTFYTCDELSNRPFGKQTIAFSERGLDEEFSEASIEISLKNKYVFAEDILEGKNLYMFSKPFEMPFKVADIIVLSTENFCFFQTPNEILEEIEGLNLANIQFEDENLANCIGKKVCFSDLDCEIEVTGSEEGFEYGKIVKRNKEFYYVDSLILGAIFSSPEIYECNVKRLMSKINELGAVYLDKMKLTRQKGCGLNIEMNLIVLMDSASNLSSSKELGLLYKQAKDIDAKNRASGEGCQLY